CARAFYGTTYGGLDYW
nr:immunoglobulin heavy chain junction region [Macaca mulatta]